MDVIIQPKQLDGTGIGLVDMILEDIENHVDQIARLANAESPDGDAIEYHQGRFIKRLSQLKGVVSHHGI